MGKSYRAERLGEEIKKVVSELVLRGIKDPRLSGIVSISGVDVTPDYSIATLYISVLDNSKEDIAENDRKTEILEAFKSSKGLIRKEVGRRIKLKHVPDLLFKLDTSLEYGQHIADVLARLNTKDKTEDEKE